MASSSIIRRLYTDATHVLDGGVTHDSGVSAVAGFALGVAHRKMNLDKGSIPLDALGGALVMFGGAFGPSAARKYLGGETVRQAAEAAIAVGMARVGERFTGGAKAHGDFGATSSDSSLLREAEKL